jgi:hypothetical protein
LAWPLPFTSWLWQQHRYNHHRLRELLAEMEDLTLAIADERASRQRPAHRTRQTTA